ncbi:MAG: hypothetical protein QOG58_1613 [Caballeronia sp.]|nr:hypothetical protein [Caballeronia sp.]
MTRYAAHVQALDAGNAESHVLLAHAIGQIGGARTAPSPVPNSLAQVLTRPSGDSQ